MTPLERAEKVVLTILCQSNEDLAEAIRVAIVEATNEEIEKRRAVEEELEQLRHCWNVVSKQKEAEVLRAIARTDEMRSRYEDDQRSIASKCLAAQSDLRDLKHGLAPIRRELAEIAESLG